jgi:hypothetical protein
MSERTQTLAQKGTSLLSNRIDRLQILCRPVDGGPLPSIPDFTVISDSFVRRQTTITTYRRVRRLLNPISGTQIFAQYDPAAPWLWKIKLTFIPRDQHGLLRAEVEEVLRHFPRYRLLAVELTFDFNMRSGVDEDYIRRHALFGKSRPQPRRKVLTGLRYGTRKSTKLVRCPTSAELRLLIEVV